MQRVHLILGKTAKVFSMCFCCGKGRRSVNEELPYVGAFESASHENTGSDNVLLCDADNIINIIPMSCETTSNIPQEVVVAGTLSNTLHHTNLNTGTDRGRDRDIREPFVKPELGQIQAHLETDIEPDLTLDTDNLLDASYDVSPIACSNTICPIEINITCGDIDSSEASIVEHASDPDANEHVIDTEQEQDKGEDYIGTDINTGQTMPTEIKLSDGESSDTNNSAFGLENLLKKEDELQELKYESLPVEEDFDKTRICYTLKQLKILDTSKALELQQTAALPCKNSIERGFGARRLHQVQQHRGKYTRNPQYAGNKQIIHIDLSVNEDIKLSECQNAWRPKPLTNITSNENIQDILKKVRGILNKLTSDNFDVLLKEMASITIDTPEKMQDIMLLVFEKTISEPNFAPIYARFYKVLYEQIQVGSMKIFNRLLIEMLEREFEKNVNNLDAKDRQLQEITKKLNDATEPQEKYCLQAELEYQEHQFRRRACGTVHFIGELFKLNLISVHHVFFCIESLLAHMNDEKLEYMCKLVKNVGCALDNSETNLLSRRRVDTMFAKIGDIVKEAKERGTQKAKICTRVRFMLEDLIDLRSTSWGQSPNSSKVQVQQQEHSIQLDRYIQQNASGKCDLNVVPKVQVHEQKNFRPIDQRVVNKVNGKQCNFSQRNSFEFRKDAGWQRRSLQVNISNKQQQRFTGQRSINTYMSDINYQCLDQHHEQHFTGQRNLYYYKSSSSKQDFDQRHEQYCIGQRNFYYNKSSSYNQDFDQRNKQTFTGQRSLYYYKSSSSSQSTRHVGVKDHKEDMQKFYSPKKRWKNI